MSQWHPSVKRVWGLGGSLLCLALLVGCGRSREPWEVVHPASGVLTWQGQPVVGAQITLVPTDSKVPESVRPTAVTGENGAFEISTYADGDGAPEGDYKVSVIWHPLVVSEGGNVRGGNVLPPKYAIPETSGVTLTVAEGGTAWPTLDLTPQ